jgi:hypothetical protein
MKLDESKLKLLELLTEPMTVTEIAKRMNLSKATVSHHLKILQSMGLVKIISMEIERNFIKKYYLSSLVTEDHIFPQEKKILEDFRLTKEDFLRTLLRFLNVMNLENSVFLKKVGFDVGQFLLAKRIEGDVYEGLADIWEKLRLGRVVEADKKRFIVEECYNCYGLPEIGKPYCRIDEGIIEGVLHGKTGMRHRVREVRCWGTGDEVCEFEIE